MLVAFQNAHREKQLAWLINRTTTKTDSEKMLYKTAFRKKPDLSEVRDWGKKVVGWKYVNVSWFR
jgi:hypothetical protein